jgi:hypothetical protein
LVEKGEEGSTKGHEVHEEEKEGGSTKDTDLAKGNFFDFIPLCSFVSFVVSSFIFSKQLP